MIATLSRDAAPPHQDARPKELPIELTLVPPRNLLVALQAADPIRRRGLVAMVTAAGHEIAALAEADVVLLDGAGDVPGSLPVLALAGIGDHPGLLPPDATPAQIDAGLRAVAAGLVVRTAAPVAAGFAMAPEHGAPLLTPREMQVLEAVGAGHSNKAAARALGISQHTVKFHLEAIYGKLGAGGRAEAVAKGLRQGLLEI